MKILLVGGTWDNKGGKPSKIIKSMYLDLKPLADMVLYYNGGHYKSLAATLDVDKFVNVKSAPIDIVLWFPNIPNELGKDTNVKSILPKAMLVTSKNNYREKKYSFQELAAHALSLKSNLFIEITRSNNVYSGQLFDPLGNAWSCKMSDFTTLADIVAKAEIGPTKD